MQNSLYVGEIFETARRALIADEMLQPDERYRNAVYVGDDSLRPGALKRHGRNGRQNVDLQRLAAEVDDNVRLCKITGFKPGRPKAKDSQRLFESPSIFVRRLNQKVNILSGSGMAVIRDCVAPDDDVPYSGGV